MRDWIDVTTGDDCDPSMFATPPEGFGRVHYREQFAIPVPANLDAETWAREVLEHADDHRLQALDRGWRLLGRKPVHDAPQVLGWRAEFYSPSEVRLQTSFRTGLTAAITFVSDRGMLHQSMAVHYSHPGARLLWEFVAPRHRRFVLALLLEARARTASTT